MSVRMHIFNTNEYLFPILCTSINYFPPMNPVKFHLHQIQNGRPSAIFVCSNWQYIWKFCPSGLISPNNNEHCFPILYTCINYNPPMNPVKFNLDQIQNSRPSAIFVCSNCQNIWKFCLSRWICPTPMHICFRYFTHALTTFTHESCTILSGSNSKW